MGLTVPESLALSSIWEASRPARLPSAGLHGLSWVTPSLTLGLAVGLSVGSWKEPMCVVFTRVERAEGGLSDCLWEGEAGAGAGEKIKLMKSILGVKMRPETKARG